MRLRISLLLAPAPCRAAYRDEYGAGGERFLPSMQYVYRAILTSDHDSTDEQVIDRYNQRGACEKNFNVQNNDSGWTHLPFSTMEDNTVFLLFTAMLKNFYRYLQAGVCRIFPGIDMKSRLDRFVFSFIVVPAKWGQVARQWKRQTVVGFLEHTLYETVS